MGIAVLVLAGVSCALAPLAYARMFTGFHVYDDEGLFLVALRDYLAGAPLMTPNIPLYGPLYYEVYGGLFRLLGLLPSHDSGRWMTTAMWLLESATGGAVVLRLTRNGWLAVGAQLVTFVGLEGLANEPTSTYGLSSLLLIVMAGAATFRSSRPRATAVVIGVIVGALWLIKVNLGIFAGIAVAFAWAASLPHARRRVLLPPLVVAVAVFPLLLISALWRELSIVEFALVVGFALAAIGIASIRASSRYLPPPGFWWFVCGGVALIVACLGIALVGGSNAGDVWNFLFVFPLRFPQLFSVPLQVGLVEVAWAAVMLIVAAYSALADKEIPAIVRIAAGLFVWIAILLTPTSVFLLALPLVWIACRPPALEVDGAVDPYFRILVPALAVLESLQVYPVAGTQIWLAAVGLVPMGALLLADGIRQRQRPWFAPMAAATSAVAVVTFGLVMVSEFAGATVLGLPGAESVRVPAAEAADLRHIVEAVQANGCSYLITYPGMDSLYIWTNLQSAPALRYDVWYLTVDRVEQQSLIAQFQGQSRLCVVENQAVIDFWTNGRLAPSGPLVDYIDTAFVEVARSGDYELLVRASS